MVSGWKFQNIWVATTQITMRTWGAYQALFICCAVISSSSGTTKFANSHINSDAVYPWTFPADGVFRLWFRYISNQPVLGNPRCGGFRFRNKLLICKRCFSFWLHANCVLVGIHVFMPVIALNHSCVLRIIAHWQIYLHSYMNILAYIMVDQPTPLLTYPPEK